LLGFVLPVFFLLSFEQSPILAVTPIETRLISQEETPMITKEAINLEAIIDKFLTTMPLGYYTIANIAKLKNQLKKTQTLLVDVRESSEYQSGHIPDAINIPLRTLTRNLDKIPRDRPVVLYCSSGYRAAMGVMTLHLLGYDNIQGFPPSFSGWKISEEAIAY